MLIEYIERLRNQPPEVRRRAVVTWTVGIVLIIAALYIVYWVVRGTVLMPTAGPASTIAAPYESGQ